MSSLTFNEFQTYTFLKQRPHTDQHTCYRDGIEFDDVNMTEDLELNVGDWVYDYRSVSGPSDDLYSFFRIIEKKKTYIVIRKRVYLGDQQEHYKNIRLKKHVSNLHGRVLVSYRSGRYNCFYNYVRAADYEAFCNKEAQEYLEECEKTHEEERKRLRPLSPLVSK